MKCKIQKENEKLKEIVKKLEKERESLQNKIVELMQNFGEEKQE